MDEQQMTSSIVSFSKRYEYDSFLSFRGEDTGKNFKSYLDEALNKEKIKTFRDDQIKKGDKISTTLIKAIENSRISIVIFSKDYASSKWCLNELSKIMECMRVQEQIVIPVFYEIDPSHVRYQTEGYKDAFEKYKEDFRCNQWRKDLTKAANIAGYDSRKSMNDPELVNAIVKDVLEKLFLKYSNQHDGLVGIENKYEQIKSLLKIGSNNSDEVLTLGIWGMGGIGKTTIAEALYEKLSHEFGGCCFLKNVKEKSENLEALHEKIYSKLSEEKYPKYERRHLCRLLQHNKVFIVLDDVATSNQLEQLIYQFYPLGQGSRVIVTTKNKQIFRSGVVTYSVRELNYHHSLELFCWTAFKEKQLIDGYEDISRKVISYCGGIPLALKVVGASLLSKSKEVWECRLKKLQSIPYMEIQKTLKLSYDDLDDSQQSIFLDIACFFKGKQTLSMFPLSEIEVILDKSLITIHHNQNRKVIKIHDLIQDMGHEIIRQENIKYYERRSRLWKYEEVIDVLKRNKGNDVVEGIHLKLFNLNENLNLSSDFLAKMTSLRIFKFENHLFWSRRFNVYLPEGLDSWSCKLEYFHWDGYCLKSLSSNFCAEQLVVLRMRDSKLEKLWDGVKNLKNLKEIDLQGSQYLIDIPDFSKAKELECVNLCGCESLRQLHPSILSNSKLKILNLEGCREIKRLILRSKSLSQKSLSELYLDRCSSLTEISITSDELIRLDLKRVSKLNVNSRSLVDLHHYDRSSLKKISVVSEEVTKLHLSGSAISSFLSISSLPKLTYLDLSDCKEIERLDLHLKSFRELVLNGCSSLKKISVVSEEVTESYLLNSLSCDCKEIERLDLQSKSLRELVLNSCSSLKEISVISNELKRLKLCGSAITSLLSISSLPKLTELELSDCKEIERLDLQSKSLRELVLNGCSSLKEIKVISDELKRLKLCGSAITSFPSISSLPKLTYLDLSYCIKIERLDLQSKSLRELILNDCSSLKEISVTSDELTRLKLCGSAITSLSSISSLPKLTYLNSSHCKEIERLDLQSKSLRELVLNGCSSLKEISAVSEKITILKLSGTAIASLSSISSLHKLTYLDLSDCKEIERLELHSKTLIVLKLDGCSSLKKISVQSEKISKLELSNCRNLVSLPELPSGLYVLNAFNWISLETEISQHLVLQHMLQSTVPYLHGLYFALPGDHVMDKCVFQTADSSLSIHGLAVSGLNGFIYCTILSEGSLSHSHEMSVSIYLNGIELWHTRDGREDYYPAGLITDHVMFWYHHINKFDGISEVFDHTRNVTRRTEGRKRVWGISCIGRNIWV